MAQKKESDVQIKIMQIIRKYGGYVYKNAASIYTEVGRPDLTACIPIKLKDAVKIFGEDETVGLFVGLELKRPGKLNNVSQAQKIVGSQIMKSGGLWLVTDDPKTIEGLMNNLVGGKDD